ncbi:kinesin-like protein KIN-1 isoform X2 [Euphorbia lathyris]|uniref:kinesin-like protein KIN-1 isoform X2 n=1 Tax=Euphorbia lathyris TaxID=212925 RepID=UPI003313F3F7
MSTMTVCCRFRPLSSKEKRDYGDAVCICSMDTETFIFKDEKEEELSFSFDKVFYENSAQDDVYQFLALPIVRDALNAINGTIITYGQTGAGKTFSMEGPSVLESDELKKGLLPRVVDGLFNCINSSDSSVKYTIKLSMVEIYMEKVRDLLDLTKDKILIKESKTQGILLSGVTEISISNPGSEKVEKTGAEGKVLEEAKTINKSLSALGNVINALTSSPTKASHIPYRDSKLTRILQDALGGNSRTGLLCCCSPSSSNAAETLSTLRFGARAKHIKTSPIVNSSEAKVFKKHKDDALTKDEACERILNRLRERLDDEDIELLEELFILEGILFHPNSVEDLESACEDVTVRTISSLQQALEELVINLDEVKSENKVLKARIAAANAEPKGAGENASVLQKISDTIRFFISCIGLRPLPQLLN